MIAVDDDELFKLVELVRRNNSEVNKDYITEELKYACTEQLMDACKFCQNNPNNGGTGFCHCVLGSSVIY